MPKGSVRNPGTKDTYYGRMWTRATNRGERQHEDIKNAYAHMNRIIDKKDAREASKKLMKKPGAGRAALMPIKKTIRPTKSAKKGSK
jgi:hypothetical protein